MSEFYENIKRKRVELGITQSELAKKTGYSDKSMIAHIEHGTVDLPQSKILIFANALGIAPCALMGWNDFDSDDLKETRQKIIELQRYLDYMKDGGIVDEEAENQMDLLQGHLHELYEYIGMVTPDLRTRLSDAEATLLDSFRQMNKDGQKSMLVQADLLLKGGYVK